MKHIGLFEGIGGFSLAARWMGWETIAWCEWIEYNKKILRKHFPKANEHGDITQTDFTIYKGKCDIVTGGFPCQPYSTAGQRKGKEDDRHLWPEMLRAIREIQPRWVIGENVHGIINWGRGMVVAEIKADLENEGYKLFPPVILPACAVGADHKRDRTWFVAYSMQRGLQTPFTGFGAELGVPKKAPNNFGGLNAEQLILTKRNRGEIRNGDGIPNWMDRIGALGNAIVPQVAYQLFRVIALMEVEMRNCQPGYEVKCGVGKNNI